MKCSNKIHYSTGGSYLFSRHTLCGKDVDIEFTTTDKRKVTCKTCKKIMKKKEEPIVCYTKSTASSTA